MSGVGIGVRRIRTTWLTVVVALSLLVMATGVISANTPVVVSFSLTEDARVGGLEPVDYSSGKWHVTEVAGRLGIELEMKNLYLQVDDDWLTGGPYNMVVTIDFLCSEEGSFRLEYDSLVNDYAYEKGPYQIIDADVVGKWNRAEWTFEGVQFSNRQNGKSDMRIRIKGDELPLLIGAMTITATQQ